MGQGAVGFYLRGVTIIPNNKNFRPRKLAYQVKLGYDYLIFSYFILQGESQHVKVHNTLTMPMFLP